MKLLMLAVLAAYDYSGGVSVNTVVYNDSQVVSHKFTVARWTVEYSGTDRDGNIHRWREEVTTGPDYGELSIIQKANSILVEKLMSDDKQAHGFMRAVQGGQHD